MTACGGEEKEEPIPVPVPEEQPTTEPEAQPLGNDATALAQRLGWGWNLGNHFDTSSGEDNKPNQWGYWDQAKPTQVLYNNLKKAGASTVRICVTWGNYQDTDTWTIKSDYMAEVKQNVDWAEAAGLNVILNLHHDEYWLKIKEAASNSTVNDRIKGRIEKTWRQIAETFKTKGDFLFFESFNEVQDGGWGWGDNLKDGGKQYKTLNEWNQLVVNTIRDTGGNNATRWIGIPGYASSPKFVLDDSFVLPNDPANRVMVSVHFYDPDKFTLTPETNGASEWGHTAAAGKYITGTNEEHVVETFQRLQERYIAHNIPVYIGEYGCVMQKTNRSNLFRNYYLEYVCRAAHTYHMPLCIWDNNSIGGGNEHHGYFNHTDGTYLNGLESLVQTMIRAATLDDPTYTLETIYNNAPH
jgi:endoglucanase